jgi:hypothetical protein
VVPSPPLRPVRVPAGVPKGRRETYFTTDSRASSRSSSRSVAAEFQREAQTSFRDRHNGKEVYVRGRSPSQSRSRSRTASWHSDSRSPSPQLHTRERGLWERKIPAVDVQTDEEKDVGSSNGDIDVKQRTPRSPPSRLRSRGKHGPSASSKAGNHRSVVLRPKVPVLDDVLEELEELRRENRRLNEEHRRDVPFSQPAQPASTYRTFYYIEKTSYYLDEPQWVPGDLGPRLHAQIPIRNMSFYLDQHPDIAFAIFKTYRSRPPKDLSTIETKEGLFRAPEPDTQNLSFISDTMIDAVEDFIQHVPDFDYYFPNFDSRRDVSDPYLFMFYSEPFMDDILPKLDGVGRRLLEQLRECVEASHGFDYSAANSLAEKGLVSKDLFKYLIRPGDILVKRAGPMTTAHLALDWVKEIPIAEEGASEDYNDQHEHVGRAKRGKRGAHSDDARTYTWKVPVWSWYYDGQFHKQHRSLTLELKATYTTETVPINQLKIIPLRFASLSLRETLEKRGKTF